MKKIKRVGFLFCLVATMFWLLPVIGCQHSSGGGDWSDDPPEEEEPEENTPNENPSVVSRWVNSSGDYEEILTFYDDGTYTYEKYEKDELTEGQKGTYSSDISSDEETKLTVTEDYSEGKWGSASGGGFYVKITGDSIEIAVWWTEDDGTEKKGESSSFGSETNNDDGEDEDENDDDGFDFIGDVAGVAEYISSLTEKGTYSVKVVDEKTTSCSALKIALYDLGDSGIYVSLDLSESIIKFTSSYSLGSSSEYNYALVSVVLPDNCTKIGNYAFAYCSSLESVTIPSSVTSIGDYAFAYCSSLKSVTIPEGVISIGSCAFWYCSSLPSVTIPSSVTSIGDDAFFQCTSLKSVIISEGVTSIGSYAFSQCSSLESVTIPSSVTSIEVNAFYCYSSLESAVFEDTEGWTRTKSNESEKIESSVLQDSSQAATYLKESGCSWTKTTT